MNLPFATACATRLVEWLGPFSVRIEIAGSVRRRKSDPADVDLVCIPKFATEQDIFGQAIARKNATWVEIDRRVSAEKWQVLRAGAEMVSFTARGVQVDIWFATEENWGTTLLCKTGSKEHNIWLAKYAISRGGKWHPGIGLYLGNHRVSRTEEEIYATLGLDAIAPDRREAHLLPFAGLIRHVPHPVQ